MNDVLYLAWRYVAYHRKKTTILVLAIALIVFIPSGLRVLVRKGEMQLTARAEATPLLLGAKGSSLELALNSLYFAGDQPDSIEFQEATAIRESQLGRAISLYVRFHSRNTTIVGTTLDYFKFRGLEIAEGRLMGRLGDCVVGAEVARRRGLKPGDHVISSPASSFGFADGYPLKMFIAGVLAPSGSPDDEAIFVDVKTAWVIQGLAHGHTDLSRPEASAGVLRREGDSIIANASVPQYQEITDENVDSFHFHGDASTFPITAVIAIPPDHKSKTLLLGRYQNNDTLQLFEPRYVVDDLLETVFTVQNLVIAALVIVGITTLVLVILVFMLSLRLRRREIETMIKIGASRGRLLAILATEIATVTFGGILIAFGLTLLVGQYASPLLRVFLMT